MKDEHKSKDQLVAELVQMRRRVAEMESLVSLRRQEDDRTERGLDHLRSLIEDSLDAVLITDADGVVRYESTACERLLGYGPEERTGVSLLDHVHPDEAERVAGFFAGCSQSPGAVMATELHARHKDGSWRQIEVRGKNLLNDSSVEGIVLNLRDLTQRRLAEETVDHRLELERTISTVSSQLISAVDFQDVMEESLARIGRLGGASRACICLTGEDGCSVEAAHEWCGSGVGRDSTDLRKLASEILSLCRDRLSQGEAVHLKDVSNPAGVLEAERRILEAQKVKSMVVLPVCAEGQLAGFAGFCDIMEGSARGEVDLSLIQIYSQIIGHAVERRRYEALLRRKEEYFRSLIENSTDAIAIVGQDGTILYESQSAERLLGYRDGELSGVNMYEFIHREDMDSSAEVFGWLLANPGQPKSTTLRFRCKDGSWCVLEGVGKSLLDDPLVKGVIVNYRDITQRKLAEEALAESERRYRILAENLSDVIWIMDTNLRYTYVSPSVTRLRGYTVEEALAQTMEDCVTPESLEAALKALAEDQAVEGAGKKLDHTSRILELELTCKDGSTVWTGNNVTFLRDADGRLTGYLGVSRDISGQRKAQEALRESEAKYSALVEHAKDGVVIVQDNAVKFLNEAAADIMGYTIEEMQNMPFMEPVQHEWRERDMQAYRSIMSGEEVPAVYKTRVRCKDGAEKELEATAGLIYYRGRPALMAILRDVTERKLAGEIIQRKLELETVVSTVSSRFISVTDVDDAIDASLASLGDFSGVSRVSLFLLRQDRLTLDYTHGWSAGKARSQAGHLRDLCVQGFPWWMRRLRRGGIVHVSDVSSLPDEARAEKETLERHGVKSVLAMPLGIGGKLAGFMSFCDTVNTRDWSDDDVSVLRISSEIVGRALEQKQAEAALRESEAKYSAVVEQAKDAVMIWQDESVKFANKAVADMFGYSIEEVLATPFLQTVSSRKRERIARMYQARLAGDESDPIYETKIRCSDGSIKEVEVSTARIQYGGRAAVMGIIRDITERKRAEEARVERAAAEARAEELRASRRRIVTVQESLRRDIAQQLHGSVQNRLIVLLHRLAEMENAADSERVAGELEGLRQSLREVLDDHIRPISHRLYPSILRQGLVPALQSLGDHFETAVNVEMELDEDLVRQERSNRRFIPEQVRLAACRIAEEALTNVIKHTRATSVTIGLGMSDEGLLQLKVRDNDRGFDVDGASGGLGIFMMQDYAEVVGGTCVVHSNPGQGTEVTATLPLARSG